MKQRILFFTLVATVLISACQTKSTSEHKAETVTALVNKYSKQALKFNPIRATFIGAAGYNHLFTPVISQENRAKRFAFEKAFLDRAEKIDINTLQGQDLLTYKIFLRDRKMSIEASQFNNYMLPINQMYGVHNSFAQLGSGDSPQPFRTQKDYRNFIQRSQGFSKWVDSAIAAMREGIKQGTVLPKVIVAKVIPQLKAHLVQDIAQSVFYKPLREMPESITQGRKRLIKDYKNNIKNTIIPTYQKLHDFMQTEYYSAARETVGLSQLPNGKQWYDFMIKTHTTLDLSSDEIHQYGQQEVERILSEMNKVKLSVKFNGNMSDFFNYLRNDEQFYFKNKADLIQAYKNIKTKIEATLPQMFEVFPKANYEVKAVPDFQAASAAGASYEGPAADGSRPGIFYINTHNLKSQPKFIMETLSIHEAAPGHHFQIAIQQEVKGLPNYRKFGGYTVFSEGWALYAESLGKELGLFSDPYMWYGRLVDEQLRAMRLVVDTGIHAKGWTRERAVTFMLDNSSMARSDVEAEVERYIVIPGQALAYKIGQRKLSELREIGEKTLADKFDIKKFHTQLLIDGSLPMPILEEKIKLWFKSQG
jgi:uncharacterized protein (DUF885 family)